MPPIFSILWSLFSLSLLIVTMIFLQDTIHDHESEIPHLNKTLFSFVYVGHWIMIAAYSLSLLYTIFILGKHYQSTNSYHFITANELDATLPKELDRQVLHVKNNKKY